MDIIICIGSSCHIKGSRQVVEKMQALVNEHNLREKVELSGTFCMSRCQEGVCVTVDDRFFSVSPETVDSFFRDEVLKKLPAENGE
ncbi:MAG: (2Fe-2S) ferredoxin domain-containing protein [Lachnospiraceae bacterium]|nr:(2Fe-2S) ferredoxin domain-containing protein [Lachnospiraceae bacterium]